MELRSETSGDASSAGLRNIFDDTFIGNMGSSEGISAFCMPMEGGIFPSNEMLLPTSLPFQHQNQRQLKRESNEEYAFNIDSEDYTGTA